MRKAIVHLKKSDPTLRRIIEAVGPYRIQFREPVFETLVRSIVYQQLSGKVAVVIFNRLLNACGNGCITPESVLRLSESELRAAGLSQRKASYIADLAARTHSGEIEFSELPRLPDDEICRKLTTVKGIGVWTVQMFLIFALRRPDVLPVSDLGIRSAIRKEYGLEELPKPAEIEELASKWRPYCSVASWYLWRSLDNQAGI